MIFNDFDFFIKKIKEALTPPLPGSVAHDLLAPEHRKSLLLQNNDLTKAQLSSVLVLFFPDSNNRPSIVFTKRVEYKGVHSGQISFPGGKAERHDQDYFDTAYRETEEEIGIERSNIQTLGVLSELYVPPSNFIIFPVVGAAFESPAFVRDPKEVAEIIQVPFEFFFNNGAVSVHQVTTSNSLSFNVPGYMINNNLIWGATAMILSELIHVTKKVIATGG